ncbi:MAG: periplasmic heavy metal sensor [Sphingomonadaceae bacterium]|nr:periplasmic heavy metal sensor [Sphingomonadaceae bacterium]
MISALRTAALAALVGAAALPAAAQDMPPPPAPGLGNPGRPGGLRGTMSQLSPEGRQALKQAMQSLRGDGTREQIQAARQQQLDILGAETFDAAAMQRAQMAERNLVTGQQQRRQAALLAAYSRMSAADRRVLAQAANQGRAMVQNRLQRFRDRLGNGQFIPPPPPGL